jgi:hypothetical protein
MIPRHLLQPDDFLWALDHSTRRYRVRPTRLGDLPFRSEETYPGFITVIRIDGRKPVVMTERCEVSPDPWIDSDAYADFRLLAISRSHALREYRGQS